MAAPGRGVSWKKAEILDLLDFFGEQKVQAQLRASHRNLDSYEEIAQQMRRRGHTRSAKECRTKAKAMRQEYRRVVNHNARSGNDAATCPFFEELHSIFRGDATIQPNRVSRSLSIHRVPVPAASPVISPLVLPLAEGSEELFSNELGTIDVENNLSMPDSPRDLETPTDVGNVETEAASRTSSTTSAGETSDHGDVRSRNVNCPTARNYRLNNKKSGLQLISLAGPQTWTHPCDNTENMAAETFAEFLNKLKEIHEKEVHGLQTKLNELTNERGRDAQRIEELFAKNHQLREQQKVLKENVKVLENRLRAGLCDRCQVTQELAKKKQHEFGKAHFQSLQHILILTNEMNKLREENKGLKEDLKRLCSTEERPKSLKGLPREGSSTPDAPLPLLSARSRKPSAEKQKQEAEDEYRESLSRSVGGGDQSPGQRSSPCIRISPSIILQNEHALEMSSPKIANQLHGTIALMRPGPRSCSQERDGPGNGTPPPASKTPPSPQPERSPSFETYLRASKSDCHELASSYETLKFATRKEQLCLLNQHFTLRHLGRNDSSSREGGFPHHLLIAKEAGGRTRPQDEWEDQAAILELPGAMAYMKDHHLENRLPFLTQEKLHCFLRQQQQGCRARMEDSLDRNECQSPPLPRAAKECKKERTCLEDSADGTLGKLLLIHREDLEQGEKAEAMREYFTDAPLDLSDYGRGRESLKPEKWQRPSTEHTVGCPGRDKHEDAALQKACLSSWLHVAKHLHGSDKSEQLALKAKEDVAAAFPVSLLQELPVSKPPSGDATADPETKMSLATEKQETDQPDDGDSDSAQEESDEPSTSDSEMIGVCDSESLQEVSMKEKYCCITDNIRRSQAKRKRGQDSWTTAHKKSSRSGQNAKTTQVPADLQEATNEKATHSHNDNEET